MKGYFTAKSSQIDTMNYDKEKEEMEVVFQRGGKYRYSGVPWEVWDELISAESTGKAFHRLIKGKYSFIKLN